MYEYLIWLLTFTAILASVCYMATKNKKMLQLTATATAAPSAHDVSNEKLWSTLVGLCQLQNHESIKSTLKGLAPHISKIPESALIPLVRMAIKEDMIETLQQLVEVNEVKVRNLFSQTSWGEELASFNGEPTRRNEMARLFLELLIDPEELKKHGFTVECFPVPGENKFIWAVNMGEIETTKSSTAFLATDKIEYTIGYNSFKHDEGPTGSMPPAGRWGREEAAKNLPAKFAS